MEPRANVNADESIRKSPCSLLGTLRWFITTVRNIDKKYLLIHGVLLCAQYISPAEAKSRNVNDTDLEGMWEGYVEGRYRAKDWNTYEWKGGVSLEIRNTHRMFGFFSKYEGLGGSFAWVQKIKVDSPDLGKGLVEIRDASALRNDGWCHKNPDGTLTGVLRGGDVVDKRVIHVDLPKRIKENGKIKAKIRVTEEHLNLWSHDEYNGTIVKRRP